MIRYYLTGPADAPFSRLVLGDGLSAAIAVAEDGVRELLLTVARSLSVNITGAALAGEGALHFALQISKTADFAAPVVDANTESSQTGWEFYNGERLQAFPADGLPAQYRDDQFGNVIFTWAAAKPQTAYYVRYRGWDGANWGEYRVRRISA